MAKFTEEDKLMRRIGQRFNKGVVKYRLIDDDDKILVGLSGGKDSLALLELLAKRSRILKPKFSVVAVHVSNMMAFRGASFATKSSILSLISKMMTIPMIRMSATKKVLMNFLTIYLSIFLGLRSNSILL